MPLILEKLGKVYGSKTALEDVSLEFREGEITGILGPNGAGKSTLLKILAAYFYPSRGTLVYNGISPEDDPASYRSKVGYLPEGAPLPLKATPRGLLRERRRYYTKGEPDEGKVEELLDRFGLGEDVREKPLKTQSRGYRQRTGLALAETGNPSLLLLDEPFSGLDPSRVKILREILRSSRENRIILFSSHILQEVYALCDRVLIIREGRVRSDLRREDFASWENLDAFYSDQTGKAGDEK
jgi:ABC-2 type transport system ATP-binding protein